MPAIDSQPAALRLASVLLRNEDQITSNLLGQARRLPGDSRDGDPNLFNSHSLESQAEQPVPMNFRTHDR